MVETMKSLKKLNETMLKNFICTVELTNYTNMLKQVGNTSSRKTVDVLNTIGSWTKIQSKPIAVPISKTISTKTKELMIELNTYKKSELILRLVTSIEERLVKEHLLIAGEFSITNLEEAMLDSACSKYDIDKNKTSEEKVKLIKVSVEKEIKEISLQYQNMNDTQQDEMEKALNEDIEDLSEREIEDLKKHLNLDTLNGNAIKEILTKSGGALTLMMIPSLTGFSSYLALTTIIHAVFTTTLGITLPFAAYAGATSFVSILSGPIGWLGVSSLTAYTIGKNRKKLTQTIMAQIIGITAILVETNEEYLTTLPSWLNTAQKKKVIDLKEKYEEEKIEVKKLIAEKEEVISKQKEAYSHSISLEEEIEGLQLTLKEYKRESGERDRLVRVLEEKKMQLKIYEQHAQRSKHLIEEIEIHNKSIKGYVALISQALLLNNPKDKKGNMGELQVFTKLVEMLPKSTFVISQPQIGEKAPDIIVMHPKHGFRIIEVKNYNLNNIINIATNGTIEIKTRKSVVYKQNPVSQANSHLEQLYSYLASNYIDLGDQYRNIGFCIVHIGFTKKAFTEKFESVINRWDSKSKEYFFKYNLFADQVNDPKVTELIWSARKFDNYSSPLSMEKLNDIAASISIEPYFTQKENT